MSTPLYLIDTPLLQVSSGASLVLAGDEGHHAANVRRTRVGEQLDVGDGSGRLARCVVTSAGQGRVQLQVLVLEQAEPRVPALVLVQALAKGGRDEQAVETATELGVDAVVPWQAGRSIVVWSGERGERARRKWQSVARAAAKQSRRRAVPVVEPLLSTDGLVDLVAAGDGVAVVLHEAAEQALVALDLPPAPRSVLTVVGPEGGIGEEELRRLTAAGARPARLGPEVLRSSSAGPAALAVLSVRYGRWG